MLAYLRHASLVWHGVITITLLGIWLSTACCTIPGSSHDSFQAARQPQSTGYYHANPYTALNYICSVYTGKVPPLFCPPSTLSVAGTGRDAATIVNVH